MLPSIVATVQVMPRRPTPNEKTPREATARRKRRSPEQAKTEILDAAERLFSAKGPDRVAVADVAIEAGVSAALVLHYFGTYADLVRSVHGRRNKLLMEQLKQRILSRDPSSVLSPGGELLRIFLDVVCEPVHARLLAWAALSGEGVHLRMVQQQGLAKFVDFLLLQFPPSVTNKTSPQVLRQRLEEALLVAISATHGYAMGKSLYVPALGLQATEPLQQSPDPHIGKSAARTSVDDRFREALASMLHGYLVDFV